MIRPSGPDGPIFVLKTVFVLVLFATPHDESASMFFGGEMHPSAARSLALCDDLFPAQSQIDQRPKDLIDDILSFHNFGKKTDSFVNDDIRYYVNEFWTSAQRQSHSLHEISYRACFKAQLPQFFIERLTEPGEAVYDPFMGRGTTPLQAALLGRQPVGNDINPLSVLLVRPRLNPPEPSDVASRLSSVDWDKPAEVREDLLAFYEPLTLRRLTNLRNAISGRCPVDDPDPDPIFDWIRMVAINRLTGHSPGFFSVYTMPPNQAVSVDSQLRINARRNQVPQPRDIPKLIMRKTYSLLQDGIPSSGAPPRLFVGEASTAPELADDSVALVVTSPPFLNIVDYATDNWLRCWFAGIDPENVQLAQHRTETSWSKMVSSVLEELARIVRPGGHIAFEVGEVRSGKVLLERLVWKAATGLPYDRLGVIVNDQKFTKTANCWGVSNNIVGTNTNRIVILRRN